MKLFISYARVDKPLCKQIVERLEDVHEVWYDKRLHAGQEWWDEIQERLAWCEGFVYLLSPESVASEYCQREYEIAAKSGKYLFPVLIQAKTDIPKSLSHLHYANLSEGMEDMITLMNALHVAEVRQLKQQANTPPPAPKVVKPAEISPTLALSKAAEAMEAHHYDNAVFLLKEALQKNPEGRTARMLQTMLGEAETALEQQTYLREAEREYAPITALAKVSATHALACEEFADFQGDFPDYDPDKLADLCASVIGEGFKPSPTSKLSVMDILPTPFAWIELPAGKVTLINDWDDSNPTYVGKKGQSKTLEVAPFAIAKYPVTNAQFAEFMHAGGYREKRWWTVAGWAEREVYSWTEPRYWGDAQWNGGEQPVVGVSWYEAIAFCQWLSEVSGEKIRLPMETEWQWTAGGKNQLVYPWGNDWDCGRCNNSVKPCDSNQTTPVRQYEGKGDSPFGVVDMAGNVWEWCLTDYQSGVNSLEGDNSNRCVLRGGSWDGNVTVYFRVAVRNWGDPHHRDKFRGFRCARSLE